jgi:hypothetical protein
MKRRNLFAVLGLAVLSTYGACHAFSHEPDVESNADFLKNRFWLETMPEKKTDHVHGFMVFRLPRNRGIFSKSSLYDFHFEMFVIEDATAKELSLHFPQTDKHEKVGYTIKSCSDKAGFDVCLDLSQNPWGGPKRYYGIKSKKKETELVGDLRDAVAPGEDQP